MPRALVVWGATRVEFGAGIDAKHFAAAGLRLSRDLQVRAHHQDAGGDTGAVEQIRRQLDDCFDEIFLEEYPTDLLLRAAAEQHPVGNHRDDHAIRLAGMGHGPGEHEVAFLARGRAPTQWKRSGNSMSERVWFWLDGGYRHFRKWFIAHATPLIQRRVGWFQHRTTACPKKLRVCGLGFR